MREFSSVNRDRDKPDDWNPTGPGDDLPPAMPPVQLGPADPAEEEPPRGLWDRVGRVPPWASGLLLLSWIGIYGAMLWKGEIGNSRALADWGANIVTTTGPVGGWRFLAATFLHAGFLHLLFNGLAMAILGPAVERIYSHSRFWLIFASGGLVSSWASAQWRFDQLAGSLSVSVGASGAIFALGGALLASSWKLRKHLPPGRARALAGSILPLVFNGLVSGMTRDGTDNIAHASGLLCGLLVGSLLDVSPKLSQREIPRWTQVAGVVSAVALGYALIQILLHGLFLQG